MRTQRHIYAVDPEVLAHLRSIDTCTVSNAIEKSHVRLRNEGFADHTIRSFSSGLPPMVGYAATGHIRTSAVPTTKHWYYEHIDWWSYLLTIPSPRVIVMQDIDDQPGLGALFGEIHARIAHILECVGYVTNGTVRDLADIATSFHLFASGLSVSHAYAHVVDFGSPVEVGGLTVNPGDLLHGDMHGVLSVPLSVAPRIPALAAEIIAEEHELIDLCRPGNFSLEKLRAHFEKREL